MAKLMHAIAALSVAASVAVTPMAVSAGTADPVEPQVLLADEAAALAQALVAAGARIDRAFEADVAVIVFEPAGLVRLVLIDLDHRRKTWAVLGVDELLRALRRVGEAA